jgi:hypothetical protein
MTNPDPQLFTTVAMADLLARATVRPSGYLEHVLSLAVAKDGTDVLLTWAAYGTLKKQYAPDDTSTSVAMQGAALWAELHRANEPTPDLVDSITPRLSCGPCRSDWLSMLERTPPDFTSLGAWRQWTVDRHNEVNAKLAKPLLTYPEAALRWNW